MIFISSTSKYVIGKCFSIRISIQNPLYTCLFEYRTALLKVRKRGFYHARGMNNLKMTFGASVQKNIRVNCA